MGTRSVAVGFYVSCAVCCVLVLASTTDDNDNLRDVVRTLRGQVNALLERRQEDFNILEESLRRSLNKNSELATVKTEMEELRCFKFSIYLTFRPVCVNKLHFFNVNYSSVLLQLLRNTYHSTFIQIQHKTCLVSVTSLLSH